MPPETTLAVECTRIHPDSAAVSRIRKYIDAGLNWQQFLQFAIPHGILPFAASTLGQHASDLVPGAMISQMERVLARNRLRYQVQAAALASVIEAFTREKLRVLLYKGPALIALAYPDPGLREFHDLDLWIDSADTAYAGEILRGLGYQPSRYHDGTARPLSDLGGLLGSDVGDHQPEYLSPDGAVVIDLQNLELHPQLNFCPKFADLWERRALVSIAGQTMATLSTEDLLPALAVHGSKHVWRRLNWVADIAALLAASPCLDWDATIDHALQWRCHRRLLSALAMQTVLYGVSLPPEVAARVGRRQSESIRTATHAVARIVDTPEVGTLKNAVSVFYHHYHSTDRATDRLALARAELKRRLDRAGRTGERNVRQALSRVLRMHDPSQR